MLNLCIIICGKLEEITIIISDIEKIIEEVKVIRDKIYKLVSKENIGIGEETNMKQYCDEGEEAFGVPFPLSHSIEFG